MNSRVPWLFPYFRRRRSLNLSAGICAGDANAHLKENNTLPLGASMALSVCLSRLHHTLKAEPKKTVGYVSQSWTAGYVEPQPEPKQRLCNVMTSSVAKLMVEVSHLHRSNRMQVNII